MKIDFGSEDDSLRTTFYWYVESVRIPLFSFDQQIQIMGGLSAGCATELRDDIRNRSEELLGHFISKLTDTEIYAIKRLYDSIDSAPEDIFVETLGSNNQNSGMRHHYWDTYRTVLIELLEAMSEPIRDLYSFFGEDTKWLDRYC